jgi:hypothetical protein
MRGVQPEDKARAIFDMPAVGSSARTEPLPSGAPPQGKTKGGAISKIGKFLLGAAIVFGVVSLFKGGRGSEDAPVIGTLNPGEITWDPSKYGHGTNVIEYQIVRDSFVDAARPVKVVRDPGAIDAGRTSVAGLYGDGDDIEVNYYALDGNPATSYSSQSWNLPTEPYGTTHTYQVRVLYKLTGSSTSTDTDTTDDTTTATGKYYYTPVSNSITATVIEPVLNSDVVSPAYLPGDAPPEIQIGDLQQGFVNLQWNRKLGADVYYVQVDPVIPGTGPSWNNMASPVYETSPIVSLPAAQRISLANALLLYPGKVMKWRVYCRHQSDTSQAWYQGDESRFEISSLPPGAP